MRKAMENQEFWVPKHNPSDRDAPAPAPCRAASAQKEAGLGASFQTLLIILRVKSHQEARGEWLQVTKELHPEGQTSCFSHQAAGWEGKWENDRIQG